LKKKQKRLWSLERKMERIREVIIMGEEMIIKTNQIQTIREKILIMEFFQMGVR
jgi:hypothetical protein